MVLEDHTVAMHGLMAAFSRIHALARRIPIVGAMFTHLVGIPVSVTGDLRDPTVVPLRPEAVGQNLLNLMSATFKAPIELLDPSLGSRPRSEPRP